MSNNENTMTAQTANTSSGSRTVQERPHPVLRLSAPSGTLRLRAEPVEERHIQWADDVIDNEGMGKKSSKVCCIYHKPRAVDESSDESSSDSSSDSESDSEPDTSRAHPIGGRRNGRNVRGRRPHQHDHDGHDHEHDHVHGEGPSEQKASRRQHRKPSPNAYEKMPKRK